MHVITISWGKGAMNSKESREEREGRNSVINLQSQK